MTDLVALRAAMEAAREKFSWLAAANTWGKSQQELVEMDIAYRRAERAYLDAWGIYNRAIEERADGC